MPKIPSYQGAQQIAPGSGQELQSAREVASQGYGGAVSAFGQGLEAVGLQQMREDSAVEAALLREKDARKKTQDALTLSRFEQAATQVAIEAEKNAYVNTDPAGELLTPTFNKEYEKWMAGSLKGLPNDQLKYAIETKLGEIKNGYNNKLNTASREMFNQNAIKGYEDDLNFRSAMVQRNPLDYDKNLSEYQNLIATSFLNQSSKEKAIKLGREEMARSAISGLTESGDYEVAKTVAVSKFGKVFSQEEREKILKGIDAQEEQAKKERLQMVAMNEKKAEKMLKQEQRETFQDLVGVINEFSNASGEERLPPAEAIKEMERLAGEKKALGSLTNEAYNDLMRMTKEAVRPDQELVATGLYDKFASTTSLKGLEELQDDVAREFTRGNINKDTSVPLLSLIRTAKKQAAADKNKTSVDKFNQKILSDGLNAIDKITQSDIVASKLEKDRLAIEGRAARADMLNNFWNGDKKTRGNGEASFQKTMRKFFPEKINGKIPYLPQEFQNLDYINDEQKYNEETKRITDEIKRKLEAKEITKAEAKEAMRTMDIKVKVRRSSQNLKKEETK